MVVWDWSSYGRFHGLCQFGGQCAAGKGLLKADGVPGQLQRFGEISRDENDLDCGVHPPESCSEQRTIHARHEHVGYHYIDAFFCIAELLDSFGPASHGDHVITQSANHRDAISRTLSSSSTRSTVP